MPDLKRPLHIRIIGGFMLLLFAFSMTPRLFLHDLFAGHIDTHAIKDSKAPVQMNTAGYHCDKDGVVASSSFIADEPPVLFSNVVPFSLYQTGKEELCSASKIYYPLRGPPQLNIFS